MDEALIAADVRATVDRLLAQGLVTLAGDESGEGPAALDASAVRHAARPRSLGLDHRPSPDGRCLGLGAWTDPARRDLGAGAGRRCRGRLTASTFSSAASWTIEPTRQPATPCRSCRGVDLRARRGGAACRYRVVVDGRVVARVDTPSAVAVHALHHLDELAVDGSGGALLFHAGAVERDGRVVMVLGVSGKGKSTLTAALVQRGFRYLSDEIVAVDIATGEVRPYPKALDLHPGSLDLLGLDAGRGLAPAGGVEGARCCPTASARWAPAASRRCWSSWPRRSFRGSRRRGRRSSWSRRPRRSWRSSRSRSSAPSTTPGHFAALAALLRGHSGDPHRAGTARRHGRRGRGRAGGPRGSGQSDVASAGSGVKSPAATRSGRSDAVSASRSSVP